MADFIGIFFFLGLLILGFGVGSYFERQHYRDITLRERKTNHIPLVNFGAKQQLPAATTAQLFVGSVVVSADYFKIVTRIPCVISSGDGWSPMRVLLDRGRREALLRMKEQAIRWGATQVVNVRLETASIGNPSGDGNGLVAIEVVAYGTGIR